MIMDLGRLAFNQLTLLTAAILFYILAIVMIVAGKKTGARLNSIMEISAGALLLIGFLILMLCFG